METPGSTASNISSDKASHDRRWLIAALMVGVGSFLVALGQTPNQDPQDGDSLSAGGWLIILASAIAVRHLGFKLLLYMPLAYVMGIFLSMSLVVPANKLMRGSIIASECDGVDEYAGQMLQEEEALNARLEILKRPSELTDGNLQVLIDATENDLIDMRTYEVPEAVADVHAQRIVLNEGWVTVFRAKQDGSYSDQMLFDLQKVDDELERRVREVNLKCG